ncbi:hypothetical protein K431DRAFT_97283 [Polychaeton citri CBS 116435]|uniref:Uncharacterized protein n=1 Tax=Polychaeton citri CBS 116435 TaxID=1314669 RepID=A0A9P4UPJ7_9PEZI|nr:hypothetical protein K431DRAFT_97283 [Polychaeton citri CBS 116435]
MDPWAPPDDAYLKPSWGRDSHACFWMCVWRETEESNAMHRALQRMGICDGDGRWEMRDGRWEMGDGDGVLGGRPVTSAHDTHRHHAHLFMHEVRQPAQEILSVSPCRWAMRCVVWNTAAWGRTCFSLSSSAGLGEVRYCGCHAATLLRLLWLYLAPLPARYVPAA